VNAAFAYAVNLSPVQSSAWLPAAAGKTPQSNEWKEEADWHNIVLWRSENRANYVTKGEQVYVEGRLQTRSFDDRDDARRYLIEIVAGGVILLGGQPGRSKGQQRVR
jgi:single-strand DNA-binding protein